MSIVDWFWDMMGVLHGTRAELFLMSLWEIWTMRNNLVWRSDFFNPKAMVDRMVISLEDYKKYHVKGSKKKRKRKVKWVSPPSGRLKLNVDGSFSKENWVGGVGAIIRDEYMESAELVCLIQLLTWGLLYMRKRRRFR